MIISIISDEPHSDEDMRKDDSPKQILREVF